MSSRAPADGVKRVNYLLREVVFAGLTVKIGGLGVMLSLMSESIWTLT